MGILKGLFYTVVVLLVVLFIGGFFLPQQQIVERSVVISTDKEDVFQQVINPRKFNQWSPWAQIDPETNYEYSGPESGKGARMSWASENQGVGTGSWTIIDVIDKNHIDVELGFGPQRVTASSFDLLEQADGTKVSWSSSTNIGMNPVDRWIGLLLEGWAGADYEKGLANLKLLLEKK